MKRILAIVLLSAAVVSVNDQPNLPLKILPVQAQTIDIDRVTYTEPNLFSVQYPGNWLVQKNVSNYFIFWNRCTSRPGGSPAPPDLIKTDITIIDGSLETVTEQPIGFRSTLTRRSKLTIGGQDAVRFWYSDGSFDFPNTIVSYVRYTDNQTFSIASYYTASNSNAVDTIQRFHGSFRLLE
jgi:hypothetical protein